MEEIRQTGFYTPDGVGANKNNQLGTTSNTMHAGQNKDNLWAAVVRLEVMNNNVMNLIFSSNYIDLENIVPYYR